MEGAATRSMSKWQEVADDLAARFEGVAFGAVLRLEAEETVEAGAGEEGKRPGGRARSP